MRWCGFTISLLILVLSCNPADPLPPGEAPMKLEALDASCTEVWLRVALLEGLQPRSVTLKRDTHVVFSGDVLSPDTTILDEGGLLPNRSFSYTLTRPTGYYIDQARVTATTMDRTSHNFAWETTLLGDGNSSALYDVAIINDTLAYAVGEIYKRDSVGNWDPRAYNIVKWNGTTWELMRIQFYTFCGQTGMGSYPARSIFAFSPSDVWIGMAGSQIVRWNGQVQGSPICTPVSVNRLWGESPSSMWAVGNNGGIAHYNGSNWRRLESGTISTINDVWGGSNLHSLGDLVLAAAGNKYTGGETKLLQILPSGVVEVFAPFLEHRPRTTVWFDKNTRLFTGGGGVFFHASNEWNYVFEVPTIFTNRIRGSGQNNMAVVGDFGLVMHFNGVTWRRYDFDMPTAILQSVAVSGRHVIAAGTRGGRGIIIHGINQQ